MSEINSDPTTDPVIDVQPVDAVPVMPERAYVFSPGQIDTNVSKRPVGPDGPISPLTPTREEAFAMACEANPLIPADGLATDTYLMIKMLSGYIVVAPEWKDIGPAHAAAIARDAGAVKLGGATTLPANDGN